MFYTVSIILCNFVPLIICFHLFQSDNLCSVIRMAFEKDFVVVQCIEWRNLVVFFLSLFYFHRRHCFMKCISNIQMLIYGLSISTGDSSAQYALCTLIQRKTEITIAGTNPNLEP